MDRDFEIRNDEGTLLDQRVVASIDGVNARLLFIARDGRKNQDYAIALRRVLEVASELGGTLVTATVESRVALDQLPDPADREIEGPHLNYPVVLAGADLDAVRKDLTNGQRAIASAGTRVGGGAWKRAQFTFAFSKASTTTAFATSLSSGEVDVITPAVPDESTSPGLPEGARRVEVVNRFERQPGNRRACIEHYGPTCQVCGFDFGAVFGDIGEGYIHVHHVTPVSQLGPGYVIDPVTDLRPVCPNCHAMLHRRAPEPYSIEELRNLMN